MFIWDSCYAKKWVIITPDVDINHIKVGLIPSGQKLNIVASKDKKKM